VTTGLTRLDHQVPAQVAKMCARMVRHEAATGRHTQDEGATGLRTHRAAVIGHLMLEVAIGRRTQHEAATTGPVLRFGATTVADGRRSVETTGLTRRDRLVMATVNMRTAATGRRGEATGRRTHHEVATGLLMQPETARREVATGRPTDHEGEVPDRSRRGRAAPGPAVRAGTMTRARSGTRATRRAAGGRSQHGRVDAARRTDREAGLPSGPDRLGAMVPAANAADMAEGRAVVGGRAVRVEGRPRATAHRGETATPAAMRDRRAGRRIEAGDQAARRGAEADRRVTRRDGLVAGRDL